MSLHSIALAAIAAFFLACSANGDPGECANRDEGFSVCEFAGTELATCQPGQYCSAPEFGECSQGCLSNLNCACDQVCALAPGASVGSCTLEAQSVCGDGVCGDGESAASCAGDCAPSPSCGDNVCSGDETAQSCPQDCGTTPSCGDGACNGTETAQSCPADCAENDFRFECKTACGNYDFFDCIGSAQLEECNLACEVGSPTQRMNFADCALDAALVCDTSCFIHLP